MARKRDGRGREEKDYNHNEIFFGILVLSVTRMLTALLARLKLSFSPPPLRCIHKQKLYAHQPVKPNDFPLMTLFPEGVPCRSTAVPVQLRFMRVIRHRLEETLVDRCNVTCPTQPPPVIIKDSEGNPIELLEGEYQSFGEKVSIPKTTKRKVLYEPEGTHLVLTCTR